MSKELTDRHLSLSAEPPPHSKNDQLYVVGIGASAGGLEALERFFEAMPVDTGMAFVVVQHLSPDFKSLMDELLARKTAMPVYRACDGMAVQANAIYLIPPKKDMIISNRQLLLTDKDPKQLVTLPIDHFFRSLAHDLGDRAIAIVLSGTGSDGSRGIRDVHEAGGLVIVQSPETAKFDGMPNSARQTGAVDIVLPPEEMPAALLQYVRSPEGSTHKFRQQAPTLPETGFEAVFRMLRDAYGIDFAQYKSSTVSRRIERRLLLNRAHEIDDYVQRLREDSEELDALYRDLLIGVTRFFRDAAAFERLEKEVLPGLLADLPRDEELRMWVAGCATGEEAYSLAILIQEQRERLGRPFKVKIFATDVHRSSLEYASTGIYTEAQLADVSPERLARHFVRKSEGYQVCPELRHMIVFAPHNVIKDAPFTKLDLIACRNLLIYLQPPAQKKVLSLFHFGLKTNGVLFLGPSESPGELSDEFLALDTHWKIYRKRRDIRLPAELRLPLSPGTPRWTITSSTVRMPMPRPWDQQLLGIYDALLDEFMPSALLINEQGELVQTFAGANRYLRIREGRMSSDVLDMVEPDLRVVLGGALPRVFHEKTSSAYKGLRLRLPEGDRVVNLTVKPVSNQRSGAHYALILFEETGQTMATVSAPEQQLADAPHEQLQALEAELRFTKENLQATIEELETSNEELQATNEELVASNEELQSTNEELHSVNEELYTVNAEYQKKIAELTQLTADMDNLLASTQVHTLFLDTNLCIRKFTPRIAETFHLMPSDIGRRIDSFAHNIDHPTLIADLTQVMTSGESIEQQVRDHQGRWFLLRILPYRSQEEIDGCVLTLIDLTNLKRAEREAWTKDQQLFMILKNSPQPIVIKDLNGRYLVTNPHFEKIVGENPIGRTAYDLFDQRTADAICALDHRVVREGITLEDEVTIPQADGPHTYLMVKFPLRDETGKIIAVGGIKTDVTRLKRAEQQTREAVEQRDRFLAMLSHELRNPLGAIAGATQILERLPAVAEEQQQAVEVLGQQVTQMSRLLDDLLDMARITQDKIQLRRTTVRLDQLVGEAVRVVQATYETSNVTLTTQVSNEPIVVTGDSARLQQMLVNLLMNGAKYTPPGGHVELKLAKEEGAAVVRIRDTGIGIPADMLDRVFDLFVQGDDPVHRSTRGLGVGLTLVRRIAELHGGRVAAFSAGRNCGAEFVVWLPLSEAEEPTIPEEPTKRASGPSMKVVVVEDNDDSRRMLEILLKLDGHEVYVARDGQEGLETILRERPALAIIDLGLPKLDGYELARRIREAPEGKSIFLVALTGYGRLEDQQKALAVGFDQHLMKPPKKGELEHVFDCLRQRALTREKPTRPG
ncbi:MAG: PAS domain-containing protein [Gemmataceae bacterium]|nr:PAS domain-containing protein [Gemmataceae bacterium]